MATTRTSRMAHNTRLHGVENKHGTVVAEPSLTERAASMTRSEHAALQLANAERWAALRAALKMDPPPPIDAPRPVRMDVEDADDDRTEDERWLDMLDDASPLRVWFGESWMSEESEVAWSADQMIIARRRVVTKNGTTLGRPVYLQRKAKPGEPRLDLGLGGYKPTDYEDFVPDPISECSWGWAVIDTSLAEAFDGKGMLRAGRKVKGQKVKWDSGLAAHSEDRDDPLAAQVDPDAATDPSVLGLVRRDGEWWDDIDWIHVVQYQAWEMKCRAMGYSENSVQRKRLLADAARLRSRIANRIATYERGEKPVRWAVCSHDEYARILDRRLDTYERLLADAVRLQDHNEYNEIRTVIDKIQAEIEYHYAKHRGDKFVPAVGFVHPAEY